MIDLNNMNLTNTTIATMNFYGDPVITLLLAIAVVVFGFWMLYLLLSPWSIIE